MSSYAQHEDGTAWVHVMAGAVFDDAGRVLLAQRPSHKAHGGKWEFPGGKREHGESPVEALVREFEEELAITPTHGHPLIAVRHRYPDFALILDVWAIHGFRGEPVPQEGQQFAWVPLAELANYIFPEANLPIVRALGLKEFVLITPELSGPEDPALSAIAAAAASGHAAVQYRQPGRPLDVALFERVRELCADCRAPLYFNGTPAQAVSLAADGLHLQEKRLDALGEAPLPPEWVVGAACHSQEALARAVERQLSYAMLSPVKPTQTHPDVGPLGWDVVREWVRRAPLPVYALGGLTPADLGTALAHGCRGVAMIRGVQGTANPEGLLRQAVAEVRGTPLTGS